MSRNGNPSPEQIQAIETLFGGGTEEGMWAQYVQYLKQIFTWDLGVSSTTFAPVTDLIAGALPWTIGLVGLVTIVAFIIVIGLGEMIGWCRGTWLVNMIPASKLTQAMPYCYIY